MSQPLPVSNFKWMKKKDLDNWEEFTCILEVDLEYPKELYNLHNDYPLAPERITVRRVQKLIPNLAEKKKYILHCKNLKQYLDLGLKFISECQSWIYQRLLCMIFVIITSRKSMDQKQSC